MSDEPTSKLLMADGSWNFASHPATRSPAELRDYLASLPGVIPGDFVEDRITGEAWVDFVFEGHSFSTHHQTGEFWFFTKNPDCAAEIIGRVNAHALRLLAPSESPSAPRSGGMLFGFLGILAFSLTLPATRLAVASIDPLTVGLGRALVAACFAGPLLYFTGQKRLTTPQLRSLAIVILGVVFGFPGLSAWAIQRVDASHGAVVLGLLPLATAVAGFLRAHERPSVAFWGASALGSFAVVGFALAMGDGKFQPADLALAGAVALAALGYAEGARLGRQIGGWQVICWALVYAVPLVLPIVAWSVSKHGLHATPSAWAGFAYVSLFSAFLGFFAWYHGLSIGGVARVGQIQLLQPFLTLAFAALFFGEKFSVTAMGCAAIVSLSIFVSRRSKVGMKVRS